jgi:hypothetical protein
VKGRTVIVARKGIVTQAGVLRAMLETAASTANEFGLAAQRADLPAAGPKTTPELEGTVTRQRPWDGTRERLIALAVLALVVVAFVVTASVMTAR